jgi:hypothetical protein
VVELAPVGRLGANPEAPVVASRRRRLEKPPWSTLPGLHGPIERQFLRPLYLGESIAPYRLLEPALAVIPWDPDLPGLLSADRATALGYPHLAAWLTQAEALWREHGRSKMSLLERWDYYGKLSAQFAIAPVRIVYSKAGTLPAAAVVQDTTAIIDHTLYWAPAGEDEARYLEAVLNSETTRSQVAARQSRGQWGARHFDKVILDLAIPKFDPTEPLHAEIAEAAARAEAVAAAVRLPPGLSFVRARALIREALAADGIAGRIDALVASLLRPVALVGRALTRVAEDRADYD